MFQKKKEKALKYLSCISGYLVNYGFMKLDISLYSLIKPLCK